MAGQPAWYLAIEKSGLRQTSSMEADAQHFESLSILSADFQDMPEAHSVRSSSSAPNKAQATTQCSCIGNLHTLQGCCERNVRRSHKMGQVLTLGLFLPFHNIVGVTGSFRQGPPVSKQRRDYRDVMVIRNFYDALVSGYLYHKSGRECWLDTEGQPVKRYSGILTTLWHQKLTLTNVQPAIHGRSLCTYLAEESEEDGMRVLIDFTFQRWYNAILANVDYIQRRKEDHQRTLIVCYETLVESEQATMQRMLNFLFPTNRNHTSATEPVPRPPDDSLLLRQGGHTRRHLEYAGGHATSKDPNMRNRLIGIIRRLDADVFAHKVATAQRKVGCGEESP